MGGFGGLRTALLAATLLVAGCSDKAALAPDAALPPSVIALSDQFGSDFALIDQNGAPVADEDQTQYLSTEGQQR